MTREDAKKLLRYLVDCYPNFRPADMQETIEAWAKTLEEYDSREISFAAKIYVQTDTSGFPPSIGQLIEKAHSAKSPELDEMEAWSLVMSGIGNSIYHAEEEYNKLPEVCQKAIGSPDAMRNYAMTPTDEVNTVIQSNFLRSYRTICKRMRDAEKIAPSIRAAIAQLQAPAIETTKEPEPVKIPEPVNTCPDWLDEAINNL